MKTQYFNVCVTIEFINEIIHVFSQRLKKCNSTICVPAIAQLVYNCLLNFLSSWNFKTRRQLRCHHVNVLNSVMFDTAELPASRERVSTLLRLYIANSKRKIPFN